jgi:tRNA threonylcarbamoyladenosine biosynthesis protein TsaB
VPVQNPGPVLGIDTSAALSVALVDPTGAVLDCTNNSETRRHLEDLAPAIERVLAEAGVRVSELTAIAAGTGPGPFTGLRIGLVTARTMGAVLGIPVWGVPSHDALAAAAARTVGPQLLVLTDARRKEVYWSLYEGSAGNLLPEGNRLPELLRGPGVVAPKSLARELADCELEELRVIGSGVEQYRDELLAAGIPLPDDLPPDSRFPSAAVLARTAVRRAELGVPQPTDPLYLRRPDVQQPKPKAAELLSAVTQ